MTDSRQTGCLRVSIFPDLILFRLLKNIKVLKNAWPRYTSTYLLAEKVSLVYDIQRFNQGWDTGWSNQN